VGQVDQHAGVGRLGRQQARQQKRPAAAADIDVVPKRPHRTSNSNATASAVTRARRVSLMNFRIIINQPSPQNRTIPSQMYTYNVQNNEK